MDEIGVLGALVPSSRSRGGLDQSAYHHRDVLGHTLEVVRARRRAAGRPRAGLPRRAPRGSRAVLAEPACRRAHPRAGARARRPPARHGQAGHPRGDARGAGHVHRPRPARRRDGRRPHAPPADRPRACASQVVRLVRWHLPLGFMVHRTPLSLRQIDRYLRATAPCGGRDHRARRSPTAWRPAGRAPARSAIDRHLVLAREMMDAHFRLVDRGPVRPLVPGDELAEALGRPPGPWLRRAPRRAARGAGGGRLRTRDAGARVRPALGGREVARGALTVLYVRKAPLARSVCEKNASGLVEPRTPVVGSAPSRRACPPVS